MVYFTAVEAISEAGLVFVEFVNITYQLLEYPNKHVIRIFKSWHNTSRQI